MFGFNEGLDKAVLQAGGYGLYRRGASPVRTGVSNASANIADVWSLVNNLLQFQWKGVQQPGASTVNTVLGFGGLLDIATEAGVTPQARLWPDPGALACAQWAVLCHSLLWPVQRARRRGLGGRLDGQPGDA